MKARDCKKCGKPLSYKTKNEIISANSNKVSLIKSDVCGKKI